MVVPDTCSQLCRRLGVVGVQGTEHPLLSSCGRPALVAAVSAKKQKKERQQTLDVSFSLLIYVSSPNGISIVAVK